MNLDKFLGCVYGVAIGDALGRPVETMNACDIKSQFGRIEGFKNLHNRFTGESYDAGTWSDDTQLTLALMEALTESNGTFNMDIITEKHKAAYHNTKGRGWGRSTRKACQSLVRGVHWSKSGYPDGAGNGVMMKIAPYALMRSVLVVSPKEFTQECIALAKMTHLGTPAIAGAVAHAFAVASLAGSNNDCVHVPTLLHFLYKIAVEVEGELPPWKDRISDQIRNVWEYIEYGREGRIEKAQTPEEIASLFFGGTSYAPCSFGLSYALFMKSCLNADNPNRFQAVFDAVNAGGDTDSNASIVGSLVGALHGFEKAIPSHLAGQVEMSSEIRKLTTRFYDTCHKLRQNQ